jgi:hypothetical protein
VCFPLWPAIEDYKECRWCDVSDSPHRTAEEQLKYMQDHCQSWAIGVYPWQWRQPTMSNNKLSGHTSVCRDIDITCISVHWHMNIALLPKGGNVSDIHLPQGSRPKIPGVIPFKHLWQTCDTLLARFNDLLSLFSGKVKLPTQGWNILIYKAWLSRSASMSAAVCVGKPKASPETRYSAQALPSVSGPRRLECEHEWLTKQG